jgi:outer membrane protein OmpA-like peptidoglycan-associated protein
VRRRTAALLCGLAALVVLGACAGGDDREAVEAEPAEDGQTTTTADPTAHLDIEQEETRLTGSEVRLGAQIVSEVTGAAEEGSHAGGSSISASEATAVERTLSELGATRTSEGLVVTLPERVLFDFDEADLRADARASLAQVAEVITFYEGTTAEVHGHTDSRGSAEYNRDLSVRRAEAVRDELVRSHGIRADRLSVAGFGATRPVAPNERPDGRDDPEGRQQNRRVEILLREA